MTQIIEKIYRNAKLKRFLLLIAALIFTALSIAFHRGTINAQIPIDYTEDPYSPVQSCSS